jgi:hypothetical protein
MRRRHNPFGDDMADFAILAGLAVGGWFVYRYFYPSQSNTAPGTTLPPGSLSSAQISSALDASTNSLFPTGLLDPTSIATTPLIPVANPFGSGSL